MPSGVSSACVSTVSPQDVISGDTAKGAYMDADKDAKAAADLRYGGALHRHARRLDALDDTSHPPSKP